ncbi:MAG: hypothetical protein MUF54_17905 [Polyangiaceae bacterium]|jgi:hypothetical protein|nr:hypothetical protein [Polyangiaceae bacterium]
MTQARTTQDPKTAPSSVPKSAPKPAPKPDDDALEELWKRFEEEAGLTADYIETEKQKLRDDIQALEERLADRKTALADLENRSEDARQKMKALLSARLSEEAILTAMRVEYKIKRPPPARPKRTDALEPPPADDEKQMVLDHLDAEGLSIAEIKKLTDKDSASLGRTLKSLIEDGKVVRSGDGRAAKFHLA